MKFIDVGEKIQIVKESNGFGAGGSAKKDRCWRELDLKNQPGGQRRVPEPVGRGILCISNCTNFTLGDKRSSPKLNSRIRVFEMLYLAMGGWEHPNLKTLVAIGFPLKRCLAPSNKAIAILSSLKKKAYNF